MIFTSCCDIVLRCLTLSFSLLSSFLSSFSFSPFFQRKRKGGRKREKEREKGREKSTDALKKPFTLSRCFTIVFSLPLNTWQFYFTGERKSEKQTRRERKRRRTKWEAVKKERERERENVWMMMLWIGKKILDWEEKGAFLIFLLGRFFVPFSSFLSISFLFLYSFFFLSLFLSLFLSISFPEDKDF